MKKWSTVCNRVALLSMLSLIYLLPQNSWACDRSSLTLVSNTDNGTSFDYVVELCIGAGVTGTARGGDDDTFTFALGLNAFSGSTVTLNSFTPTLTSASTGAIYPGVNVGSAFDDHVVLGYISPGDPFACVSSTVACGNVGSECVTISFNTTEELASIQAYGIEGNNNPLAGCTGEPALFLGPAALPVELISFDGENIKGRMVDLNWETATETNNRGFDIERSTEAKEWKTVGFVPSQGHSTVAAYYEYQDLAPHSGQFYYRLKQMDTDGTITYSPILSIEIAKPTTFAITPNPAYNGQAQLVLPQGSGSSALTVLALDGKVVYQQEWPNSQVQETLALPDLRAGIYIVSYQTAQQQFTEKLVIK